MARRLATGTSTSAAPASTSRNAAQAAQQQPQQQAEGNTGGGPSGRQPSAVSRFLTRPTRQPALAALGVSASAVAALQLADPLLGVLPVDARQLAAAAAAVNLVWFGANASITGMEAWVKFHAPTVTRESALDVGRHVFSALNKLEVALGCTAAYLWARDCAMAGAAQAGAVFAGTTPSLLQLLPPALVALQSAWLGPALQRRAAAAVSGIVSPPSAVHRWYAASEAAKLLALALSAKACLGQLLL